MADNSIIPLRERKYDWFFIILFSIFVFTSLAADLVNGVMRPRPESGYFWARACYDLYAVNNDPLLIANPVWLRAMTFLSAFIFGPFYIVLVFAFIKGKNWIRPFALLYVGMIIESMVVLLAVEFAGEATLFKQICYTVKPAEELARSGLSQDLIVQNIPKFLAFNIPYLLGPVLLGIRMRKHNPFSR